MLLNRDKPYKGIGMEGRIATWYADNTRKTMAEYRSLADRLASDLPGNSRVLEVAPGPGYLAIALAERGAFQVVGLDISKSFVEIARENARKEAARVDFRHGDASAMPFPDGAFDFIVCRAAFKNFARPVEALNEMFRVVRPGGRALIVDLNKNASREDIHAHVDRMGLGWLNSRVTKLTFRSMLIPFAYSRERFLEMAGESKLRRWRDHRSCYRFGNGADETREAA